MPTTTHVLEGPDLEALLARVPQELGPAATIVAANKLRSGGVGGFFARERFEVVVEVPDEADRPVEEPAAKPARGGRLRAALAGLGAPLSDPAPERAGFGAPLPDPARDRLAFGGPPPDLSTERDGFAGVLDRMVRDAGAADGPEPEPAFEPLVPTRLAPDPAPTPDLALAPEPTPRPRPRPRARTRHESPPEPVDSDDRFGLGGVAAVVRAAPSGVSAAAPVLDPRWLEQVGIPDALAPVPRSDREALVVELLRVMEQVPRTDPLPTGPGSVIAVVGPRQDALGVARRLADDLGTDPDAVVVAAPRSRSRSATRIDGPDQASEQRRSWRRRRGPTVVAVDAPPGAAGGPWVVDVLDALEPTMAWGVVDASRKPEDIRRWADHLGGLDALAVTGVEETCSPATVLAAGIPVGFLDGHRATPIRWTAVLARHLEVAA